jgi:SAM-dependent methyltransferase
MSTQTDPETVRQTVRAGYGKIAGGGGSCCGPTPTCCGSTPGASDALAQHIGYSAEELAALPEGANLGLSCGNPNALAALRPGEVVLDLGAGAGFDVFIAGRKVGPTGRAIGVDMTPEMLAKARQNTATYRQRSGLNNVEFRLGEIEHLPVADHSVDVIISNCVVNLSPDKPQVWREIARVLKPGGRVAVSDLALRQPLPASVAESVEALVGCVAGAVLVSETERMVRDAGLVDIELNARSAYIDGMVDWQDPLYQNIVTELPAGARPSDYLTSLEITARKPTPSPGEPAGEPTSTRGSVTLEVYDPALCCPTGVCGPTVDPALVRFAADLKWLQEQGVAVRRFSLSQNPAAFVENERVKQALTDRGDGALPLLLVDGQVVASGRYPERSALVSALGLGGEDRVFRPAVASEACCGAANAREAEAASPCCG